MSVRDSLLFTLRALLEEYLRGGLGLEVVERLVPHLRMCD